MERLSAVALKISQAWRVGRAMSSIPSSVSLCLTSCETATRPEKPVPTLGGYYEGGFHAALADGSARFVPETLGEETFRRAIEKADGKPITWP